MSESRKPAAYPVEPERKKAEHSQSEASADASSKSPRTKTRKARAVDAGAVAMATPDEVDIFTELDDAAALPPPATAPRRRFRVGVIFFAAFGALVSLAIGLWTDRLIRDLFDRADWLGWTAAGLAALAVLALAIILIREALALSRLASVEKLRKRATEAFDRNDAKSARAVVGDLVAFVSAKPQTAAGRASLAELENEIIDGGDLVGIAETELMTPLDAEARKLILDAAKRVSLVTAVSPRALVDIAYVVFEAGRLIRRLSETYGGRPGTLGFFRLARSVLAHLAVTGSIALGDSVVQQIVGHGLAAKLSAKLGEGVVNGMMTARIGIAAMETARPMPFSAVKPPRMSDFVSTLTSFAGSGAQKP